MKTEVKNIDSLKKELSISVEGDIVKNKFEDVFKKIGKEAKVKGFRPGHLPRDILEKEFSTLACEQVLKELIPELYSETLEKERLPVLDLLRISDVKLERFRLSFKAEVEIAPEIAVKNYKELKICYKKIKVTADEIKRNIDSLKESRKIDALDDNCAKGLGYLNLEELERAIERQISVQKENAQHNELERQIIEQLTRDLDFKLPQSLVNRQLEDLVRHAKMDMALYGIPKEKIAEQENELRKELEPQAKNQVKVYLILSAIAKKENMVLDEQMPHKVMEFLFKEASWEFREESPPLGTGSNMGGNYGD
jgi:FKBP-type peptidyl-prolyl cis-trans isomerase (trigger factor)